MSRSIRCGLIQASNPLGPDHSLEKIKKAMIDKHLKLIEQALAGVAHARLRVISARKYRHGDEQDIDSVDISRAVHDADGLLCFEPNIAPRLSASVWEALESGDGKALIDRYALLLRLNLACSKYGNPRSLKDGMTALGLKGGALRKPYLHLTDAERADLKASLDALRLDAIEHFT